MSGASRRRRDHTYRHLGLSLCALARGVLSLFNLRAKLGPILWQFPAQFRYEHGRFEDFLALLPRDTASALALARRRDPERMRGRVRLAIDQNRPLRHAVEIRSETFLNEDFIALLRRYDTALVVADTAQRWPMPQDVTADFVYVRLHGDTELYQSGYGHRALESWAQRIADWHRGEEPSGGQRVSAQRAPSRPRDVYCYFDNTDVKLRAPFDAERLQLEVSRLCDGAVAEPSGGAVRAAPRPTVPAARQLASPRRRPHNSSRV